MDQASKTPLLDRVKTPAGPARPCHERTCASSSTSCGGRPIDAVSVTGGPSGRRARRGRAHRRAASGSSTRRSDRLIWDVGHQAYPHKILTGRRGPHPHPAPGRRPVGLHQARRERIRPVRRRALLHLDLRRPRHGGGARSGRRQANNVVCVIGDGAMSAGMAYEAMNNAGARNERLIVILNDNDMSIAPPVGALSNYLARISSSGTYLHLRDIAKQLAKMPAQVLGAPRRPGRGDDPHLLDRRHAVRGAGLLLRRADRRPRPQRAAGRC